MGGRPTFVGLIALSVAILGVGGLAAPRSAMAEFRVPLPGSEKRQVTRKSFVRPSRPSRNPTRVFAGVSAAAISPEAVDNSEAVAVAGTSSSARVALALPAPAGANKDQTEPTTRASLSDPDPAKDETVEGEIAATETGEGSAASDTPASDDGADSALAEAEVEPADTASNEDPQDEDRASAQTDTSESDSAEKDPVKTAETETVETEPEETKTAGTETNETEPSRRNDEGSVDAPVETAALEAVTTEAVEPEQTSKSEDAEVVVDVAGKPETSIPEAARSLDGTSVVLRVSPPPEAVLKPTDSSDDNAEIIAPTANAKTGEEPDDAVETKVASLTPLDAPAADIADVATVDASDGPEADAVDSAAADQADGPEATSAEAASSAEEEADADAAGDGIDTATAETGAEDKDSATAEASRESAAQESNEGEEPNEAGESNEEVIIAVSEPPPPPAHPVIARVREKLEEPNTFKGVAASDLTALKTFYGEHEEPPLWITEDGFSQKAKAIMAAIGKADDWGLDASSFDLPAADTATATEKAQADAEIALSAAILSYARDAQIGRLTPSRVSKLFDQHPKLRDPKTVLTEISASGAPEDDLVALHPQHTQFKRLQQALARARDSARVTGRDPERDRNVQLIAMNMERWRWLPRQLGNYYVWNNVPEFEVRVLKGGQSIYREKTIVGQYKYATPFFSAPMRNIVFHPNWTVPPTIVKEDIAPKLRGPGGGGFFAQSKKNVLRRYGLAVSYKGEPIDADTVDWNNVNVHKYTFTQDPGPANVLGQFKFNFPNKHAIYMHDTVQKELFSERTRTLSHGCIRVRQPDRLAALLLSEDKGWSINQVHSVVARNQTKVIPFNKRVPVHLTYFTATVDENGTVRDFADIYGIDSRMAQKLFDNPEYFPMPAPSPAVETSRNTQPYQDRRRRPSNNGLDGFLSGLFGN